MNEITWHDTRRFCPALSTLQATMSIHPEYEKELKALMQLPMEVLQDMAYDRKDNPAGKTKIELCMMCFPREKLGPELTKKQMDEEGIGVKSLKEAAEDSRANPSKLKEVKNEELYKAAIEFTKNMQEKDWSEEGSEEDSEGEEGEEGEQPPKKRPRRGRLSAATILRTGPIATPTTTFMSSSRTAKRLSALSASTRTTLPSWECFPLTLRLSLRLAPSSGFPCA